MFGNPDKQAHATMNRLPAKKRNLEADLPREPSSVPTDADDVILPPDEALPENRLTSETAKSNLPLDSGHLSGYFFSAQRHVSARCVLFRRDDGLAFTREQKPPVLCRQRIARFCGFAVHI